MNDTGGPHHEEQTNAQHRNAGTAAVVGDGLWEAEKPDGPWRPVKMHSTLIDAEIAGCRTILSNRVHSRIHGIRVFGENGAAVRAMAVYAYRMEQCR